jgi:hypothetical protein
MIFLSSPICKNISLRPSGKSSLQLPPSCPKRGALRKVINAGRDAVDAGGASDEGAIRGRRSRVVLTPRRRRQVSREDARDDGDKKARSPGRARRKPLKPSRVGTPGESGGPVVTMLVCFLLSHARLRVQRAPGVPHALFGGQDVTQTPGACGLRDREAVSAHGGAV